MEGQNYTVNAQQFLRISVQSFQQLNSAAADEPEAISASSPAGSQTEQCHIQTHPTHAWHFMCSGENAGFQPAPSQSGWCAGMPGEHCTIPNEVRHAVCWALEDAAKEAVPKHRAHSGSLYFTQTRRSFPTTFVDLCQFSHYLHYFQTSLTSRSCLPQTGTKDAYPQPDNISCLLHCSKHALASAFMPQPQFCCLPTGTKQLL